MSRTARRAETVGQTAGRAAVAGAAVLLGLVLSAGPALADHNPLAPQEGADEHAAISTGMSLLLFALLPLVLLVAISALVWLPGVVRGVGGRYRPGRGWAAAPVWFAGPADPVAAVETAQPGAQARGGASGDW